MFKEFARYFLSYILKAKTRQRLLFLALIGLFISSFALIVLQSMMGGLQESQIRRSKAMLGAGMISLSRSTEQEIQQIRSLLKENRIDTLWEYQIELLIRNDNYLAPVIVHGVDLLSKLPPNVAKRELEEGVVLGTDLAYKLKITYGSNVHLVTPSHVDQFLGDIPRVTQLLVENIFDSGVPDVDLYHVWVRLPVIQNLIRKKSVNNARLYGEFEVDALNEKLSNLAPDLKVLTWEEQNNTLVWALGLETTVMLFLFATMTLLVSLCITAGLMIFFRKIKMDLASFWILGASRKRLRSMSFYFLTIISALAVGGGLALGVGFLTVFKKYGFEIMPDVFVDRTIPIEITAKGLVVSFLIPFFISMVFSYLSLLQAGRSEDHLKQVRSIG